MSAFRANTETQIFSDASVRAAAIPITTGQIGFQVDTETLYVANGLTAGAWVSDFNITTFTVAGVPVSGTLVTRVFANDAARTAATPVSAGQLGFQLDTFQVWWASNTSVGGFDTSLFRMDVLVADSGLQAGRPSTDLGVLDIYDGITTFRGRFSPPDFGADREYTLADRTGTMALIEDVEDLTFQVWANTAARTAAVPYFTGQIGLQLDTGKIWKAVGVVAGDFSSSVFDIATLTVGKVSPTTDDGAPLGDTTHNFSDVFLATGAVINYQNGNVVVTHSSGVLTVGIGDLRVTTAGSNAASVVTIGGTQTLLNKTLEAPTVHGGLTLGEAAVEDGLLSYANASNGFFCQVVSQTFTDDRTHILPDANGTYALLGTGSGGSGQVSEGGTGLVSYTVGDLIYASGTTTLAKLADVATGNALISGGVGAAPSWGKIGLTTHVSGTLPVANGGTALASYAVGDLIYASGTTTLAKLADVATGNALISGGVGAAPSWGKITTSHTTGIAASGANTDITSLAPTGNYTSANGTITLTNGNITTTNGIVGAAQYRIAGADAWLTTGIMMRVAGSVYIGSGGSIFWANSTDGYISSTQDCGFTRDAAGIVRTTNGSTGYGLLRIAAGGATTTAAGVGGTITTDTTQTGNVGTGEDTLQTYNVPAATLNVNGNTLRGTCSGTIASSVNAKRLRVKFGATTIFDTGAAGIPISAAINWVIEFEIIRTGAATQKCNARMNTDNATLASYVGYATAAETLSGAVTLLLTGEAVSNNDIVKETFKLMFEQ